MKSTRRRIKRYRHDKEHDRGEEEVKLSLQVRNIGPIAHYRDDRASGFEDKVMMTCLMMWQVMMTCQFRLK
jgi:hypothetical protein